MRYLIVALLLMACNEALPSRIVPEDAQVQRGEGEVAGARLPGTASLMLRQTPVCKRQLITDRLAVGAH
jgi:hypothetical protein